MTWDKKCSCQHSCEHLICPLLINPHRFSCLECSFNKIRNKEVITDTTETQRTIRDYLLQATICTKMDHLEEMDKFLERCILPRSNQEEIENMSKPTTSIEIESVISETKETEVQDQMASQVNSMECLVND